MSELPAKNRTKTKYVFFNVNHKSHLCSQMRTDDSMSVPRHVGYDDVMLLPALDCTRPPELLHVLSIPWQASFVGGHWFLGDGAPRPYARHLPSPLPKSLYASA